VVWSCVYLALCRLLQLVVLLFRSERSKELEILVLRHELAILRRQPRRAKLRPVDRAILAALSRALPRSALGSLSVRPATLLRWHRELVNRRWTYPRRPGRPWLDRRLQALLISLESRRIEFVACTPNPTGAWVTQQARNLRMTLDDRQQPLRFLIHDRDSKFGGGFDHVFRSEGVTVIRTPIQVPNVNAHAERWVGSVRRECLDRLLIFSRRQLEQVLRVYARHYNRHRPHRPLALRPPGQAGANPKPLRAGPYPQLTGRALLGGLIHEYEHAA
jgi:Integrase core domain